MTATMTDPIPGRAPAQAIASRPASILRDLPVPVLLYIAAVTIPIAFWVGPLFMTTLRLFLLIMTIPLTVQMLRGRYGRVFATDILFILYLIWSSLAIAISNPEQAIQQTGSVGIEFLGGYAVGRAYIRTRESFVALCRLLILIVLCLIPFAISEALTGRPPLIEILRSLPGITSVQILHIDIRLGLERVQAVFAHPIHFGLFCSIAFSLCFVALKGIIGDTRRYIISAAIALSGFLALSSGAILAIVLQISLILWAAIFNGSKWRWWYLIGLFALGYVVVDVLSNRSPIKVFMSYATFSPHNAYWRGLIFEYGMKEVWSNPVFGIGLNDWDRPAFMHTASVDNFWLVLAMRYGIPAFLFLATGYALVIARVIWRDFGDDVLMNRLRRAWVFTFLGLTFTLCTVHIWTNIYSFILFMFGSGVWFISARPSDPSEPDMESGAVDPRELRYHRTISSGGVAAPEPLVLKSLAPERNNRYSRFPVRPRAVAPKTDSGP
ncbi:O-antigen ligase [Puniceibacterium sp. IMCC21224]|uniref:O-antigen ligase family protein n=1 Tax=Puniceibacterium sp. IMCC21224 TaxID=1618204 RepID=UPI0018CDE841|nr:O-antigen ligase family protein [Puniceibacterium sp. IMCC21224]